MSRQRLLTHQITWTGGGLQMQVCRLPRSAHRGSFRFLFSSRLNTNETGSHIPARAFQLFQWRNPSRSNLQQVSFVFVLQRRTSLFFLQESFSSLISIHGLQVVSNYWINMRQDSGFRRCCWNRADRRVQVEHSELRAHSQSFLVQRAVSF